ncbi:MAG: substrate-binding domain-containing protein, partial [Acidimicrobiales bacterium]
MRTRLGLALVAVLGLLWTVTPAPAGANPAAINGSGSTYVGNAMRLWTSEARTNGLSVNYAEVGSPAGLTTFGANQTDFAGTEAEFSALQSSDPSRGYQYIPDVAGAVAMMYKVKDTADRPVDYLRLSRLTVAKIFMGYISRWNDPAISADNNGIVLPDQAINVVYRAGQSGTTALFYDFVQKTDPGEFAAWAARNQLPTNVRILSLDQSPGFAPKTQAFNGSDQIAQYIASNTGMWSIGYDEFSFAINYRATTARIQNASGAYILPYAQNISSALEGAHLNPDLSQELSGVYNSPNADAYPISAYSYIVTQCAPAADRPTCKGTYANAAVTETLSRWLRYIACEGQIQMATIGYSPLPPNLSQEVANAIGRMAGAAPEQLTPDNCANPRFRGPINGPTQPPDPLGVPGAAGSGGGGGAGDGSTATTVADAGATEVAAGATGAVKAVGGGSTDHRTPAPLAYDRPG